jgi:hypothetical protein
MNLKHQRKGNSLSASMLRTRAEEPRFIFNEKSLKHKRPIKPQKVVQFNNLLHIFFTNSTTNFFHCFALLQTSIQLSIFYNKKLQL